jgi:hypothetical protein
MTIRFASLVAQQTKSAQGMRSRCAWRGFAAWRRDKLTQADRNSPTSLWQSPRQKATHRFLAQHVRILDRNGDRFLVEFADGSCGWHEGPLIPVEVVEREALR